MYNTFTDTRTVQFL